MDVSLYIAVPPHRAISLKQRIMRLTRSRIPSHRGLQTCLDLDDVEGRCQDGGRHLTCRVKSVSAEQFSPGDLRGFYAAAKNGRKGKVSMAAIDLLSPCDERISIEWNARRAVFKFKISKR